VHTLDYVKSIIIFSFCGPLCRCVVMMISRFESGFSSFREDNHSAFLLALSFLLGVAVNLFFIHRYLSKSSFDIFFATYSGGKFVLFFTFLYVLILLLGTSRVGFYFIPLLFCFRGFSLSSMFFVFHFSDPINSKAFISVVLSGFLSTVAMFILAEDCLSSSRTVYRICNGLSHYRRPFIASDRAVMSLVLFTLAALPRQLMIS